MHEAKREILLIMHQIEDDAVADMHEAKEEILLAVRRTLPMNPNPTPVKRMLQEMTSKAMCSGNGLVLEPYRIMLPVFHFSVFVASIVRIEVIIRITWDSVSSNNDRLPCRTEFQSNSDKVPFRQTALQSLFKNITVRLFT